MFVGFVPSVLDIAGWTDAISKRRALAVPRFILSSPAFHQVQSYDTYAIPSTSYLRHVVVLIFSAGDPNIQRNGVYVDDAECTSQYLQGPE